MDKDRMLEWESGVGVVGWEGEGGGVHRAASPLDVEIRAQVSDRSAFVITRVSCLIPVQLRRSSVAHIIASCGTSCLDVPSRERARRSLAAPSSAAPLVIFLSLPLIIPLAYYQRATLYSTPTVECSPQLIKTRTAAHFVVTANLQGSSIILGETLCFSHGRRAERSPEVLATAGRDSDVLSL